MEAAEATVGAGGGEEEVSVSPEEGESALIAAVDSGSCTRRVVD